MNYCLYHINVVKPKPMSVRATISKEKLDNIKNNITKLITNQATADLIKLFDEGALISRMCCKVKKKFRGEKLFRRLKQIANSIKKLHQINIPEVISILLSTFENGMPTKQAGQWAGTRILAAVNLISHLQKFTEGVAQLIVKTFQNGQCWSEMNIALAMVSRVWILTKSLNKSLQRSYRHYTPLVDQLKMVEVEWIPNFKLPKNLNDTLLENSHSESEEELVERPGSVMSRRPELVERPGSVMSRRPELVERPGSVMSRRPELVEPIMKKRKRPGKQIRMLLEKHKNKIKMLKCN